MSAQIDVPKYTYLKRGVYYFVRRIPSDLRSFYRTDRVRWTLGEKTTFKGCIPHPALH
jgi:hypothetical protein